MNHDLQNKIDEAEASLASQMEYINGMKDDRALSNYPSLPVHSYLWAFSEGAKFGRNDKQIQSLKDENEKFREALISIASYGNIRHSEKEYWLSISHDCMADVLANDTLIAREALSPQKKENENE